MLLTVRTISEAESHFIRIVVSDGRRSLSILIDISIRVPVMGVSVRVLPETILHLLTLSTRPRGCGFRPMSGHIAYFFIRGLSPPPTRTPRPQASRLYHYEN